MTTNVSRRQARETAFQYLYGCLPSESVSSTFSRPEFNVFCGNFAYANDDFAWELVEGTGKNVPAIDETITRVSTNWRLERMSRVDLTVLRMGAYEILHRQDIPKTVAINEAVELAKRFGAEDSASFVNGVLDKLEKPAE
jgi:transcription antitermination protein NusB